jgi:hypothetical protein
MTGSRSHSTANDTPAAGIARFANNLSLTWKVCRVSRDAIHADFDAPGVIGLAWK